MAAVNGITNIVVTSGQITVSFGDGGTQRWDWDGASPPNLHGLDLVVAQAANQWLNDGGSGSQIYTISVA